MHIIAFFKKSYIRLTNFFLIQLNREAFKFLRRWIYMYCIASVHFFHQISTHDIVVCKVEQGAGLVRFLLFARTRCF